jgi:hypothetical protein
MKRLLPLLAILTLSLQAMAQTKVFVYINSHNEDNIGYLNGIGGYNNYRQNREALIQLATLTKQKGAKQNWGSDHVALRAIAKYDTGTSLLNTNGKNLARWMSEDMGVECDPHSHETSYNYGDVAYFMNQLGVPPSGNISGFLFSQLQNGHNWEDYQDGIPGDSFPSFTWYPNVLWGGGSPNHIDDLNYYGCYKPKSMAEVNTHEPNNHLMLIGTGCTIKLDDTSTIEYNMGIIRRLLSAIETGQLPANGIYTQEIMCNEGTMKQPWFLPMMEQMIDSINVLVAQNKVQWAHLSEIRDYWKNEYDSIPFVVDCDYNTVIGLPTSLTEVSNTTGAIKLYPNPAGNTISVEVDTYQPGDMLYITDITGKEVFSLPVTTAIMHTDISRLSNGIYMLRINGTTHRFIKQ